MFIVIEGIDGSGKTTLSEKLKNYLLEKGTPTTRFSEPTQYESGLLIRKFLSGEIHLSKEEQMNAFIHDRQFSVEKNILPSLNSDQIVILDRYYYSTAAYQASTEYSPVRILNLNLEKKFPVPNILFYMNLSPEIALERLKARGKQLEIFESLHQLQKIHSNFLEILPNNTIMLDATLEPDSLLQKCLSHINFK